MLVALADEIHRGAIDKGRHYHFTRSTSPFAWTTRRLSPPSRPSSILKHCHCLLLCTALRGCLLPRRGARSALQHLPPQEEQHEILRSPPVPHLWGQRISSSLRHRRLHLAGYWLHQVARDFNLGRHNRNRPCSSAHRQQMNLQGMQMAQLRVMAVQRLGPAP